MQSKDLSSFFTSIHFQYLYTSGNTVLKPSYYYSRETNTQARASMPKLKMEMHIDKEPATTVSVCQS